MRNGECCQKRNNPTYNIEWVIRILQIRTNITVWIREENDRNRWFRTEWLWTPNVTNENLQNEIIVEVDIIDGFVDTCHIKCHVVITSSGNLLAPYRNERWIREVFLKFLIFICLWEKTPIKEISWREIESLFSKYAICRLLGVFFQWFIKYTFKAQLMLIISLDYHLMLTRWRFFAKESLGSGNILVVRLFNGTIVGGKNQNLTLELSSNPLEYSSQLFF